MTRKWSAGTIQAGQHRAENAGASMGNTWPISDLAIDTKLLHGFSSQKPYEVGRALIMITFHRGVG